MRGLVATLSFLLLGPGVASADSVGPETVHFAGAEVSLHDLWSVKTKSGHKMVLVQEGGGAFIEVHGLSKAPATDRAALQKLVDDREGTEDVVVTAAAKHEQNGLRGIAFRGTLRLDGRPVTFSSVALDGLRGRAVLAIAYVRPNLDATAKGQLDFVMRSIRAAPTR